MSIESSKTTLGNTAGKSLVGWIVLGVGGLAACCFFQPKENSSINSRPKKVAQVGQPIQALSVSSDLVDIGRYQSSPQSGAQQSYVQNISYSAAYSNVRDYSNESNADQITVLQSEYPVDSSELTPLQSLTNDGLRGQNPLANAMVHLPPSPTAAGHPAVVPPLANELFGRRMALSDRSSKEISWPDEDYVPARREMAIASDPAKSRLSPSPRGQPSLIRSGQIGQLVSSPQGIVQQSDEPPTRSIIRQPSSL